MVVQTWRTAPQLRPSDPCRKLQEALQVIVQWPIPALRLDIQHLNGYLTATTLVMR